MYTCIAYRNTGLSKPDEQIIFALLISIADSSGRAA
jgi:hypothetical protein